jgi:hypothetical protein
MPAGRDSAASVSGSADNSSAAALSDEELTGSEKAGLGRERQQEMATEIQLAAAREQARRRAVALAAQKAQAARAAARQAATHQAAASQTTAAGSPQQIAQAMLASYGWSADQFSCLNDLWSRESGWNVYAANPSSGA